MAEVSQIMVDNDHLYIISKADAENVENTEAGSEACEVEPEQMMEVIREKPAEVDFFKEGSLFRNLEHFEKCMQEYVNKTHTVFVISDSKKSSTFNKRCIESKRIDTEKFKYQHINYVCKHFGAVRHSSKLTGQRKHSNSFRIGCRAKFMVIYSYDAGKYKLVKCNFEHNHPIGPEYNILYPENRHLSPGEEDSVKRLIESKSSPKAIIDQLKLHHKITEKDIKNFKQRLKVNPDIKLQIGKGSRPPLPYNDIVGIPKQEVVNIESLQEVACLPAEEIDLAHLRGEETTTYEIGKDNTIVIKPSVPQTIEEVSLSLLSIEAMDSAAGTPAANLQVEVWLLMSSDNSWIQLTAGTTDPNGHCDRLLTNKQVTTGNYKLVFNTGAYFQQKGEESFFPHIEIEFRLQDDKQKIHIPVHISPNGYSTCCVKKS